MLSYQHDGALEDASTLPGVLSTQQQPPAYRGNSVEGGKTRHIRVRGTMQQCRASLKRAESSE